MVGILIRLRFTIQRHTLSWKRHLGRALGLVAAALTWAAVLFAEPAARHDVLVVALAMWLVGWVIGPILTSGASVLRPEYFTLLPLPARRLGLSLLASVFVGVGAAATGAGFLAIAGYGAVSSQAWTAVVGLLAAALFLVGVVALSRTVYALLGAAMRSRLGLELAAIQYGALFAGVFAGWLIVSPIVTAVPTFLSEGLGGTPAAVLDASPAGWPVRAVDAAADGDVAAALGWLGLLAAFAALAVAAAVRLLTPYVGNRTSRRRRRPLGSRVMSGRALLPTTPTGAVVGKELRIWWRDPWRSLEVRSSIWFGILIALILSVTGGSPYAPWAGMAIALMVGLSGANLYGQDGTALWQLVVAQSPRAIRADVRGRQIGIALALGLPALVLVAAVSALASSWTFTIPIVAVILALLGAGSGASAFLSVVAVTPGVEPAKRVNANDAGENSMAIQIGLYTTLVLASPTLAAVGLHLFAGWGAGAPWAGPALLGIALVNALVVPWWLGGVAIRTLSRSLPETFARLRYPGMKVASAGKATGGVVDFLARTTEQSAHEARKAAAGQRTTPAAK
ncbi:conserved hypothetical protein [Beutenbergia cavernae DSM 12333]|uniref:Integral membrane transport protein n=1 Tax=Beutenbergia cavernae (strain ATCC BAA-8 / DSM 12333 / CCUG 43141 / JCM 11478 / NBRC 16432 / NCIMB 13614 / HKI 0122) TaxID=471853 RepID=C5BXQ5_BEUC1|nr:hypothetical protein [Beutenbergia cavernae]ACQ80938.1 conserved hypothetical protein [Beutenbergia cavernae DSM 12333]